MFMNLEIVDGKKETNPTYANWRKDDMLLKSFLSETLTEEVCGLIIGLETF